MREILWEKKELRRGTPAFLEAEYYLLVEEIRLGNGLSCETYGIKLSVQTEGSARETVSIPRISPNTKRMTALMDQLSQNLVTPASLPDILDDWLTVSEITAARRI